MLGILLNENGYKVKYDRLKKFGIQDNQKDSVKIWLMIFFMQKDWILY